jgi:hypothetical protein
MALKKTKSAKRAKKSSAEKAPSEMSAALPTDSVPFREPTDAETPTAMTAQSIPTEPTSSWVLFRLLFGWLLIVLFFLSIKNFQPGLPPSVSKAYEISQEQWRYLILLFGVGMGFLAWGFRSLPRLLPVHDVSTVTSRLLLFLVFLTALGMRVYRMDQIEGHYWQDYALPMGDAALALDLNDWFILAPYQPGEPFYSYLIVALFRLFPDAWGFLVQRWASILIDMSAIWVFYLLGKEFGSRRIGLLMAALGAFNKPMMALFLCYMRMPGVALAVGLIFLFSMRIFRKPNAAHFLQWSLAVSFGFYTYTAYRPMAPYFILAVLLWILFRKREKPWGSSAWILGLGLLGLIGGLFVYEHRFILNPDSNLRALLVNAFEKWYIAYFASAALVAALLRHLYVLRRDRGELSLLYWTGGVLLILALVYPLINAGVLSSRLAPASVLTSGESALHQGPLGVLGYRIWVTFLTLFHSGSDRNDMYLFGDSFFDAISMMFIVPGLILVLFRPSWRGTFVLVAAIAGMSVHVLADPGGSRLSGCITPLLLLGALGVDRILNFTAARRGLGTFLAVFATILLLVFGTVTSFQKQYLHFMKNIKWPAAIAQQAIQDHPNHRVYLGVVNDIMSFDVLLERHEIHLLTAYPNTIELGPDEKIPDVVMIFMPTHRPSHDTVEIIKTQFPNAQIENIPIAPWMNYANYDMTRVRIPSEQIDEDPSKYIHVRRVPPFQWVRRYFSCQYRMGRGVIGLEEKVADLMSPLPERVRAGTLGIFGLVTTRYTSTFHAPTEGRYSFKILSTLSADFWIGKRQVLRIRPSDEPLERVASVRLKAGDHPIRYMTFPKYDKRVQPIWVQAPGSSEWIPLQNWSRP